MGKEATIVFMGEDSFSNIVLSSLLKAKYNIPLVVSPLYDNNKHLRLENTAIANGIEYIREKDVNSQTVIDRIEKIKPDLLITAHFEKLLKKDILEIPRKGCLNLHPSLLPYYRGMAPQHWPIINGEKETGITVHFMDETADTGNIVLQKRIELADQMYVSDLQLVWAKMYQTVMCEAVEMVMNGYKGIEQDKSEGSYYGKLKPAQCKINTDGSVNDAYKLIRGVSMPYHGAFIEEQDVFHIIWRAEIISKTPLTEIGKIEKKDQKQCLSFRNGTLLITKFEIREK